MVFQYKDSDFADICEMYNRIANTGEYLERELLILQRYTEDNPSKPDTVSYNEYAYPHSVTELIAAIKLVEAYPEFKIRNSSIYYKGVINVGYFVNFKSVLTGYVLK